MKIEPPNLNVPLYRRDFSKLTVPVMAGLLAWLWHRPTAFPQAAISFIVGGAFLWFVFGSTISYRISHHRIPIVRVAWLIVVVLGAVWFMRNVIPYLHALV
jgi:hypothetical protein